MGANFAEDQIVQIFKNAIRLQKDTGITVSATFNNTNIPSTWENLEIFSSNLQYLYDAGLRSMTQPSNHWMSTGMFKNKFPELFVKNTILKRVATGQDFWNACESGYDYVNLDRILLRDEETLKDIKKAQLRYQEKTGKYVFTAMLANEGCRGRCPTMDEHYVLNNCSGSKIPGTDRPYFQQMISQYTCPLWRNQDPAYLFKMGNLPPYREDVERMIQYVDVIKTHGREGMGLLNATVAFVSSYADNLPELYDLSVRTQIENLDIPKQKVDVWRNHIRNCKFQCWDCHLCDELVASAQKKQAVVSEVKFTDVLANYKF